MRIALSLLLCAGCASSPRPPPDLAAARAELRRARIATGHRGPTGGAEDAWSGTELREAEEAMREAELFARELAGRPEAYDAAYVARRRAERARIAAVHAADLEALDDARRAAARIRQNLARRQDALREEAERRERVRREHAAAAEALWAGLEDTQGSSGELFRDGAAIVLSIPADLVFWWRTSHLQPSVASRLDGIAAAIAAGPRVRVLVRVFDDKGSLGEDAPSVARRRAARVRDAFVARGLAPDAVAVEGEAGPERSVELVITEVAPLPGTGGEIAATPSPPSSRPAPPSSPPPSP